MHENIHTREKYSPYTTKYIVKKGKIIKKVQNHIVSPFFCVRISEINVISNNIFATHSFKLAQDFTK